MSEDTFLRCVSNVPNGFRFHFSGFSEPWLNPNATRFMKILGSMGKEMHIYTTLIGTSMDDVREICNSTHITKLCIHTPDTDGHMRASVDDHYLERLGHIIDNIDRKKVSLRVVCYGSTHPIVQKICQDKGVYTKFRQFSPLNSRASNVEFEHVKKVDRKSGSLICRKNSDLKQNVLVPNGDLYLCCCDYGLKHKLGNLARQSYQEIYSDGVVEMLNEMKKVDSDILCRTCENSIRIDK